MAGCVLSDPGVLAPSSHRPRRESGHRRRRVVCTRLVVGHSDPGAGSNPFTGLTYDSHGSIVTMGDEVHGYDAANRHLVTTQASERDVLLVVGNPGSLNKRDEWMRDRLEDGGWTVTIVDDNVTTAGSATGKQVVVISESVGGSGLTTAGTALASVAVPIVAAESYIFDELGMTGTGSNQGNTTNSQNSVDITAAGATHPLGAGFVQGNLTTATSAVMGHAWGKPNSNATVAATIAGDATKATIFGYDTGAAMVTGTAAAARVGFMYYGGNGATHFNDNAAQLFDASIQWAAKSAPGIQYQRDATDRITSYTVNGVTIGRYAYTASSPHPCAHPQRSRNRHRTHHQPPRRRARHHPDSRERVVVPQHARRRRRHHRQRRCQARRHQGL